MHSIWLIMQVSSIIWPYKINPNITIQGLQKPRDQLLQYFGISAKGSTASGGSPTSKRNKLHAIHPYLLRGLEITAANQVWQVDITYLRMGKGSMYLVAVIDVCSRYVVGWTLSNSLDTTGTRARALPHLSHELNV